MKFAGYLRKEMIFLGLPCNSKKDAIEYLAGKLCDYYKLSYKREVLHDVIERENIKSTGLGHGFAVLHGRTELADRLYAAFGRSDEGIDWGSIDNKPVHYMFFIVGPTKLEEQYLEALGDISRIMVRHDVREGIHNAKKPKEVIRIIKESGTRHEKRSKD